jgi:hypothetical protein
MNPSTPLFNFKSLLVYVLVFTAALGAGCGGGEQSSSSTNWLRCQSDADCAVVAGAVCRSDSICVDSEGRPIPASAVGFSASGSGAQGGAAGPSGPEGGGGTGNGAGATAAGAPANMAGGGGLDACPAGPPAANTPCSAEGMVCDYAGSPASVTATCAGGVWVDDFGGGSPAFVCPSTLPEAGSNCPKPPTPQFSPLVCIFDCANKSCQNGSGCGAFQANCTEATQTGEWHWASTPRFSCP